MTTVAPAEELLTNPASIYSFTFHVFACIYPWKQLSWIWSSCKLF